MRPPFQLWPGGHATTPRDQPGCDNTVPCVESECLILIPPGGDPACRIFILKWQHRRPMSCEVTPLPHSSEDIEIHTLVVSITLKLYHQRLRWWRSG